MLSQLSLHIATERGWFLGSGHQRLRSKGVESMEAWKLSPDFARANLSRCTNYASLLRRVIFSPTQVSMQAYNTFYYGNFTGSAAS